MVFHHDGVRSVGLSSHGYHAHLCPIRGENGEEIAQILAQNTKKSFDESETLC